VSPSESKLAPMPSRIAPYLLYEDVAGALDFLSKAFGFRERLRSAEDDGTVTHADMELGGDTIMMGDPGPDYVSPKRGGHPGSQVHVYVDDVEGHFERAKAAGATILAEPKDQPYGDRRYDAEDPEGHRWSFAQRIRDVPPEEWGARISED
jgi:PhnB protein